MPSVMISKRFFDDAKIMTLPPSGKLLYLFLLLRRGDVESNLFECLHDHCVTACGGRGVLVATLLDQLQSFQLLRYEKIALNIKEKNIIENKLKESNKDTGEQIQKTEIEKTPAIKSTRSSSAKPRGCISEFYFDDTAQKMLNEVTESLQRAWLAAYPSPQWICHEIRKAAAWCEANPKKRPKDFGRFMNTWLSNGFETFRKGLPTNKGNYVQQNNDEIRRKIEAGEI